MEKITYISVTDICNGYSIERTYVQTLKEFGLINIESNENDDQISSDELSKLEKIMRFQNELEINLEGIQVIMDLLHRMEAMKEEMRWLKKQVQIREHLGYE